MASTTTKLAPTSLASTSLAPTIDYEEALTQYYRLKQRYDSSVEKIKDNVQKKYEELSIKQKRKKVERALKCIKCKKNGGTFFSVKENILSAVCGNSEEPCNLHIEIKRAAYKNMREREEKYANNIERIQDMIIKIKLNLLFGYATEEETVNEFNKYRDLLNERTNQYRLIQRKFLAVINNENLMVEEKENQLLALVDTLKQMHTDYLLKLVSLTEEQKNQYTADIIDHYLTKIIPLNEEIIAMKYKINEMDFITNGNGVYPFMTQPDIWFLSREPYSLKEMEMVDEKAAEGEGSGKVLKFVK
jgi:hypothetical protein